MHSATRHHLFFEFVLLDLRVKSTAVNSEDLCIAGEIAITVAKCGLDNLLFHFSQRCIYSNGKGFGSHIIHVTGSFPLDNTLRRLAHRAAKLASDPSDLVRPFQVDQRDCFFRNAAQRRFVASMIAFRPAALSFRFSRAGSVGEAGPDCFLAAAHLFRWAAAILERAAADIRRPTGVGPLPSVALGFNIWRSSAI